ncbi:MAG: ABC transporter permease [Opitutales bacterium]
MAVFSKLSKDRFRRFRMIKRAWYSFIILSALFVLSLFAELLCNDRPYIISFNDKLYFPIFKFYPEKEFGGKYLTEADYVSLRNSDLFKKEGNWMLLPPVPHSPLHSYMDLEGTPPHPPSAMHWLGTDASARDVFARLLYGFRICMLFSLILAAIATLFGILIGGVQGYFGGVIDLVVQRMIEIWSSLPFLYVVILVGTIYSRSFMILILVLSLFQWIGLSYYMRGEFLKIRNLNYVKVAKTMGMPSSHILFRQILPNGLTPVITLLPFPIIGGIGALTALDFLGFGLQPPTPSWGELLSQGLNNLFAPWLAVSTVVCLFTTLLLATFIGEGVREAFDPRASTD